jgi:Protein of unknown function (DUF2934)
MKKEETVMSTRMSGSEDNKRTGSMPTAKIHNGFSADQIHEMIRLRAYHFYEERGSEDGHDVEDWVRAEAEVHSTLSSEGLKAA